VSFPRKRESMFFKGKWIPAFAGMTNQELIIGSLTVIS